MSVKGTRGYKLSDLYASVDTGSVVGRYKRLYRSKERSEQVAYAQTLYRVSPDLYRSICR